MAAGVGQFGSGWAWLAVKDGKIVVMKTPNGENPLVHGAKPILGCDVWEHSYYIDYRNRRPDYIKAFLDHSGELGVCRGDVQSRDHAQSGLKFHASRTNTGAAVSRAFLLPSTARHEPFVSAFWKKMLC